MTWIAAVSWIVGASVASLLIGMIAGAAIERQAYIRRMNRQAEERRRKLAKTFSRK